MRTFICAHAILFLAFWAATPAQAQLRTEDLLRLGVQILNEANRPPPRQQPRYQQPPRQNYQQPRQQNRQRQPASTQRAPQAPARDAVVAEVQQLLNGMGYDAGSVDGRMGPRTRQAIVDFQRDHGLPATGQADAYLVGSLRMAQGGAVARQAPAPRQAGPSFDCAAARQPSERAVCDSPELMALDNALARAYSAAIASGTTDVDRQTAWMVQRNLCAGDWDCLAASYRSRLVQLGAGDPQGLEPFAPPAGDPDGFAVAGDEGYGDELPDDALADWEDDHSNPTGTNPTYADFVHMALMSDAEAYLAEAEKVGLDYLSATGTEQECRRLWDAQRKDEFARREAAEAAAAVLHDVILSLPNRPRRFEVPIQAIYNLGEYDFARQGFPFAAYSAPKAPIREAGVVLLRNEPPPTFCRGYANPAGGQLIGLGAAHDGVPAVDFIPMPENQAQQYRAAGNKVMLKATLLVEPRDQGRGPLKGRITSVAAYDEAGERLLHRWNVAETGGAKPPAGDARAWSGELLAALVGPAMEPGISGQSFDSAAVGYFRTHQSSINAGNLPPDSPLPLSELRGRQPEVVVSRNRERLRASLHENVPSLPLTVAIEQEISPYYDEATGLKIRPSDLDREYGSGEGADPLSSVNLSTRDLPLYDRLSFVNSLRDNRRQSDFRQTIMANQGRRIALELDRIVVIDPVPMDIELAAARGLVGYTSSRQRDTAVMRWELEISEVRDEKNVVVISAELKRLSYRWRSDGAPIVEIDVAALPTVSGLRQAAEAALPPRATADNVMAPPSGTPFGAEVADLLQLRYQPDTVDDAFIERMMITRYAYESSLKDEAPMWGSFFRDVSKRWLTPEQRKERLAEFREWSEARAASLPDVLTLSLPLREEGGSKVARFERRTRHPYENGCRSGGSRQGEPTEQDLARERLCGFLEAAWNIPEPALFLTIDHNQTLGANNGPRSGCAEDHYCRAMYDAHSALKLPRYVVNDIVQVDRLPELDAGLGDLPGDLVLEIDVRPTGATAGKAWPSTVWMEARAKASEFSQTFGLNMVRQPEIRELRDPVVAFQAQTVAARVVDVATGAVVAEPTLIAPPPLPVEMLEMPESEMETVDILGIRLGTSFEEADRLIREHMEVGRILTADRSQQLESVSGQIQAYTSGRIYEAAAGNELIAIFDEPPAAPDTVLGIWRILRLPQGEMTPASLKAIVTERYGEPSAVPEVGLPFMQKGLAFLWYDNPHPACSVIDFTFQTDLWRDETGGVAALPPFISRSLFPILNAQSRFLGVNDSPLAPANFCPYFLGVRFATYDGKNHDNPAGDEIVTWLSNNRAYAEKFYESLSAPAQPVTEVSSDTKVKF